MKSVAGKVVWVTGAGTGIGQAGALALAADGAELVLSGRRPAPLEETAARIAAAGGRALVEPLNVADADAVRAAVARIADLHGRLDILVHSAGINVPNRTWAEVTDEAWERLVAIDLSGAFHCAHAVLPMMRAQRDGLIINVASWASRYVSYLSGPGYAAAKHGMLALSESLNIEEGRYGLRACALCPGEVATPLLAQRAIPVPAEAAARMIQCEDMGEVIRFVARMPERVCLNEILLSPTWNRGYRGDPDTLPPPV